MNGYLASYIWIYKDNQFTQHWEVNNFITENDSWDNFDLIRSLNSHGYTNKIKGITPRFFAIVCDVLTIEGDNGQPLLDFEKY